MYQEVEGRDGFQSKDQGNFHKKILFSIPSIDHQMLHRGQFEILPNSNTFQVRTSFHLLAYLFHCFCDDHYDQDWIFSQIFHLSRVLFKKISLPGSQVSHKVATKCKEDHSLTKAFNNVDPLRL